MSLRPIGSAPPPGQIGGIGGEPGEFASAMSSAGPGFMAPGFGVYVHWPFCAAKCPYCDFNSHVRHQPVDQPRFARAFASEIAHMAALAPDRTVTSIFLGGGTPSLMAPATVAAILDAIARHWTVAPDAEVTLEANPSSVEAGRFAGYRAAGVNRVSLGVQSLYDDELKRLGRLHDSAQAFAAIETARALFPRLSFDLIYARPGQTVEAWTNELGAAIDRAADHLSLYQLTIEDGTPFAALHRAGKLTIPDPDEARALYDATADLCAARGLPAYEISNHARPGAESRHNLVYWRYGEYVPIGPGAHGRLIVDGNRRAFSTERHPETWAGHVEARGHGLIVDEPLSREEQADEMLLMGLRLREGLDLDRWQTLAGRPLDPVRVSALKADGLLEHAGPGRLRATPAAWPVLNAIVTELA